MSHTQHIQNLAPAELQSLLRAGNISLVDVREPAEHAAEHIEGASLHPLSAFDPHQLPQGSVVFHCGTGKRSLTAIQRCLAAGLPHAAHLAGGITAWKQAGLPTKK
ncbi:MAG TPA: rhodanese-like domain-containing protein [Acetobacteraceae bacterium]|nr:rhodanese-like domain-containing protein [Acetobacteraceae bacterium]